MYLPDACGAAVAAGRAGSSDLSQTGFFLRWSELCGHSFVQRLSLQQGFQTAAIQRAQHIFFQSQLQLSFGKMPFFNYLDRIYSLILIFVLTYIPQSILSKLFKIM